MKNGRNWDIGGTYQQESIQLKRRKRKISPFEGHISKMKNRSLYQSMTLDRSPKIKTERKMVNRSLNLTKEKSLLSNRSKILQKSGEYSTLNKSPVTFRKSQNRNQLIQKDIKLGQIKEANLDRMRLTGDTFGST